MLFPGWIEPILACLPRSGLRWAESRLVPSKYTISPYHVPRDFRIAFVKQAHLPDHPCCLPDATYRQRILSSRKKTGMLSLFHEWQADFWMVTEDSAPECSVWQEDFAGDADPASKCQKRRAFVNTLPSEFLRAVDDIDWSSYHLVISSNLSIPSRLLRQNKGTVWAYLLEQTGTSSYRNSWLRPAADYDLFLNGLFRRFRIRPSLRRHVIEMPYNFQTRASYRPFEPESPGIKRQGILLEKQTAARLSLEQIKSLEPLGPIYTISGPPENVIHSLLSSKYYLQFGGKPLWGNGMLEACVAGCLSISEPRIMHNNSSIVFPTLAPKTWNDVTKLLTLLENDPICYRTLQTRQQQMAEWLSFERPGADLLAAVHRVRRQRSLPDLF